MSNTNVIVVTDTFLRLKSRYSIRFEAEGEGAMRVGSGLEGDNTDAALVRQSDKVFIPGSSLKGVIRSTVERLARSIWAERTCVLFAEEANVGVPCGNATRKRQQELEANTGTMLEELRQEKVQLCPVCVLFGSPLMAGRLKVKDASLVEGHEGRAVVRHGVGIDRDTGTAKDKIKYDYELLEDRPVFSIELQLENVGEMDLALLFMLFSEWKREGLSVGGKRSSGMGKLTFPEEGAAVSYFDEDAGWGLIEMLESDVKAMEWKLFEQKMKDSFSVAARS